MRRLFSLIFQLLAAALAIILLTAVWVVFDGQTDLGEKADLALVLGHEVSPDAKSNPLLDRVIDLYNEGEFSCIVVSGSSGPGGSDEPSDMAKYLEGHGIPSSVIIKQRLGGDVQQTARDVAGTMKSRQFQSVMIVTDYYRVTLAKLALAHEGIKEIQKAHVGKLQTDDALRIGREVVALYDYVTKVYFLPAAEKAGDEAKVGLDKAQADAAKAKERVDKGLDDMSK